MTPKTWFSAPAAQKKCEKREGIPVKDHHRGSYRGPYMDKTGNPFFFEMQLFISAGSEKSENTFGFYFFFELSMIYFWGARKKWKSQAKLFFSEVIIYFRRPWPKRKKKGYVPHCWSSYSILRCSVSPALPHAVQDVQRSRSTCRAKKNQLIFLFFKKSRYFFTRSDLKHF